MKISIIGAGNMGGAIARGLSQGTKFKANEISISDVSKENIERTKNFNPKINTFENNTECIKGADIIVLAVKPWLVEKIAAEIKDNINYEKQIILSIAAGVTFEKLKTFFPEKGVKNPVIFRMIPNTAIDVLESFSCIASENSTKEQEDMIVSIFNELGLAVYVPENQIDAFMALCSCGIAYAFRYIRAATEGGVEMGIYPEVAKKAVMQTLKGAVALIEKNNSNPEVEIDKVTTPGGTTIKGLNEMEHHGFTSSVIKGLKASYNK